MIIGITGLIGSGKGAVANVLVEKGFIKLGHSNIIAEEVSRRGLPITRECLVLIGNEMRKIHGLDYWAKKLIEKIERDKDYVVEGFRNIAEIQAFRKLPEFFLLGVAAGKHRRFSWILQRAKPGDPTDKETFEQREQKDFLQQEAHGQQNALCFAMADRYLSNEGTLEELKKEVERCLSSQDDHKKEQVSGATPQRGCPQSLDEEHHSKRGTCSVENPMAHGRGSRTRSRIYKFLTYLD